MLELHQFPPSFGLLNASPFCMKVEMYLKMSGADYRPVDEQQPNGPKGKLPYIKDVGKVIGDSSDIIDYLKETRGDPLDADLSEHQKARATLIQRTLEEHLYFALLYFRWVWPRGWKIIKKPFFSHLPPLVDSVVGGLVRGHMKKVLHFQGMGRHSEKEVAQRGAADIAALAQFLGEDYYFLGENPSSLDACAYAFLANMHGDAPPNPLCDEVARHDRLVAYCARMKERYLSV